MSFKSLYLGALAACLLLVPAASYATSTPASTATVSITATVDPFAEWTSTTPAIVATDWNSHVNATNTDFTAHVDMTLNANTSTTIKATAGDASAGILTLAGQTLVTTYELVGAGLDTADSAYRAAASASLGDMFHAATSWTTTHASAADPYSFAITLNVKARTPTPVSVEPGDYSTSIVLTASW